MYNGIKNIRSEYDKNEREKNNCAKRKIHSQRNGTVAF
jgi:hypothetical protein